MKIIPPRPIALAPCLVGGFLLLGAACDKHTVSVAHPATVDETFALTAEWPTFAQSLSSKADILFMVDDSSSMTPLQRELEAGFSDFMSALEHLPGGVPDLHIGVVSSSMGAGRDPSVEHCPPGGDRGILQNALVGLTCNGVTLTDHFLAVHTDATSGQLVSNYGSASLADAFGCIADLGESGCGFEHQFASVVRALGADGASAPAENAGFLRPEAFLAVILVTNEDDCSAPPDSDLFDSSSMSVADPLGPLQSFRCNEFGHLCLIDGKLQKPPRTMATGDLQGCRSAEDGRLLRVKDVVNALQTLKNDPARLFVGAITGPATPYAVGIGPSQVASDPMSWPFIQHSCVSTTGDGVFADPAVRIAEAVGELGGHGLLASICDDTLGPVLNAISTHFSAPMAAACVPTPDPAGPGCTVVDRSVDDAGNRTAARVPSCADSAGVTPCWTLVDDAATCGVGAQRLHVDRGGAAIPATLMTAIDCTAPHP
jgi:hypothetical protein